MADRPDDRADDRPFLSRWSKRKQRAGRDAPDDPRDAVSGKSETEPGHVAEEELAANRAAAEAINIDELDENSDYSPFFKAGVPSALKSSALHRLWRSNPVFANIDGLNDYDDDFTFPTTPLAAIKTAWKFGRGFLSDDDLAGKDEAAPGPETPQMVEPAEGGAAAVAEAATSEPDPVSPAPIADKDPESGPAAEPAPQDAAAEKPDPHPLPSVGLRNRLDMAAFSGRDDD